MLFCCLPAATQAGDDEGNAYNLGIRENIVPEGDDDVDGTMTTTALLFLDPEADDSFDSDQSEASSDGGSCTDESDIDLDSEIGGDDNYGIFLMLSLLCYFL